MNEPLAATQDLNADTLACAAWIARFLKARGIDRIFGLQGGHTNGSPRPVPGSGDGQSFERLFHLP